MDPEQCDDNPSMDGMGAEQALLEQTHDTASRILRAALQLFVARGFRSTTVRDIMNACNLTPGSLYVYFSSKDDLLATIISEAFGKLLEMLEAADPGPDGDVADRLSAIVNSFVKYVTIYPNLTLVSDQEWRFLGGDAQERVVNLRRQVVDRISTVLEIGVESGEFQLTGPIPGRPEINVTAMAILNMGLGVALWYHPGGRLTPEDVAALHEEFATRMVGIRERAAIGRETR